MSNVPKCPQCGATGRPGGWYTPCACIPFEADQPTDHPQRTTKPMSIAKDSAFRRALKRYAEAVENKAFEGTIPYIGSTPAEQAELDAMHEAIDDELKREAGPNRCLTPFAPPSTRRTPRMTQTPENPPAVEDA